MRSEVVRSEVRKESVRSSVRTEKASDKLVRNETVRNEVRTEKAISERVTIDNVVNELEEARQIAKQSGNAAAMVSATLGKAKVLGLVVDKQETNKNNKILALCDPQKIVLFEFSVQYAQFPTIKTLVQS